MSLYSEPEPYARMLTGDTRREQHGDCVIDVTAASETGFHSGRRRFHVHCTTCREEVHPATTGPEAQIESHLRDVRERRGLSRFER